MRIFKAEEVHALAPYADLVDALEVAHQSEICAPERHHHTMGNPKGEDSTLLIMPAWREQDAIGVKVVTICPENAKSGDPAVRGLYLWQDGKTGNPLAIMDGAALTARRTACSSALAARHLAREDASIHLMVGAGALAPHLMRAHATQRKLDKFLIWARKPEKAEAIAEAARAGGMNAASVADLKSAAEEADIISCATLSNEPLVKGAWLKSGAHLDLVGAFNPQMRESDDDAVRRATVFCDTKDGVLKEGGDITSPIAAGVISPNDIAGELRDLASGAHAGRTSPEEITLYKSVGAAIQDFAAASLVWKNANG